MNTRTYLVISIIISTLSLIMYRIEYQLVLFGVCVLLVFILNPSKRRFLLLWKRLRFLLILILFLFMMQLFFRQSDTVLFQWKFITIYSEGVLIALIVSIRLLILLLVVSLLFDIPFYNFVLALRDWKLPYEICLMIASTFSFLRLFEKQFMIMKDQLKIREISFRKIPICRKFKAFSTIVFPVLAQAMYTVRSRAIALDLKGFRLHPTRTNYISHKLKWFDYLVQILAFLLFIVTGYFLIIK